MRLIRPARPASRAWNIVKTYTQTAFMWTTALYVMPSLIVRFEPSRIPPMPVLGYSLLTIASIVGLWSAWTMAWHGEGTPLPMDTARRFVIHGPYRFVRNPMALAGLAQGAGVGIAWGSPLVLLYVVIGGLLWQVIARPLEEKDLELRFGEPYRRYCDAVPCWRPRVRPYEAGDSPGAEC